MLPNTQHLIGKYTDTTFVFTSCLSRHLKISAWHTCVIFSSNNSIFLSPLARLVIQSGKVNLATTLLPHLPYTVNSPHLYGISTHPLENAARVPRKIH